MLVVHLFTSDDNNNKTCEIVMIIKPMSQLPSETDAVIK